MEGTKEGTARDSRNATSYPFVRRFHTGERPGQLQILLKRSMNQDLVHDDHRVGSWSNTAVICSMNEPPVGAHTSPSLRNERIESLRSAEPTRVRKCRNLGNLRKFSHRKRTDFCSIDEALSCLPRAYSTCPTAAARHACQARRISRVPAAQDCSGRRRLRSAI